MSFEGKAGLVTGAGSGIGRAAAIAFARRGASVLVCDINEARGRETVEAIGAGGAGVAHFQHVDVRDRDSIKAMVEAVTERWGHLDYAFNNAGVPGQAGLLTDIALDDWDNLVRTNLTSVFLCLRYELRAMLTSGGGAIVNTSSQAGVAAQPKMPLYTATKHGVTGLTRAAAVDYVAKGIRVNAICPGVVMTPMSEDYIQRGVVTVESMSATTPIGRMAEPEECGDAAVWLCSDEASYINGVTLLVDGGARVSTV